MAKYSAQAVASWCAADVQTLFNVDDATAKEFLSNNESHIQDRMIDAGWEALETLGIEAGLKKVEEINGSESAATAAAECGECGALIYESGETVVSNDHAESCSLNPKNIVEPHSPAEVDCKSYTCVIIFEQEASSPEEAASMTAEDLRNPEAYSPVIDVYGMGHEMEPLQIDTAGEIPTHPVPIADRIKNFI